MKFKQKVADCHFPRRGMLEGDDPKIQLNPSESLEKKKREGRFRYLSEFCGKRRAVSFFIVLLHQHNNMVRKENMKDYIAPKVYEKKFTCPHCGAIALQRWQHSTWQLGSVDGRTNYNSIRVGSCDHCEKHSLWLTDTMLYPDTGRAPQPNADLPASVKPIYLEAAAISTKSPRGAAALLRLAIQTLCAELGGKGKDINADIATLVKQGLPERVQQALDIVRVTGNNAVHPGQIDVDDPEVVGNLFELINVITEYTISMPGRISGLYAGLPPSSKEQIEKRDKKS